MAKGVKTGGRKAGTQNKLTVTVKQAFEDAFKTLQADPKVKLVKWGKENPTEFYKLSSKLIPAEITANINVQESALELLARGTGSKK